MTTSLANQLLIAMPVLRDPNFERTVIYLCEHQEQGSIGIIINRPMVYPMSLVFEELHIKPDTCAHAQEPVLFGGPIQPERGFVIHKQTGLWRSSLYLQHDVTITTSNDIIHAIALNQGPRQMLLALGYAGWDEDQLEKEVNENVWLVCPYKSEILYEVPFEKRWEYAGATLGIKMSQVSIESGHA